MNLDYNKPLYILAFDHRSTLVKKMFNWPEPISPEQADQLKELKKIIYEGLRQALVLGLPKEQAAVLVDEEFGGQVLQQAKADGILTIQTTEKSGQEEFDFQYEDFGGHLRQYGADFAKALVRYNPEGDRVTNEHSRNKLKILSDYCHQNGLKFLIEPLIAATAEELEEVAQDVQQYDQRIRPVLTVRMIKELQDAGVEPDIWKIEGLDSPQDYEKVLVQARSGEGRSEVSIVVLGRGESQGKVEEWLKAGAQVPGVVGFAVGRTIFWQPLMDYKDAKLSRAEAAQQIGRNYFSFYQIFSSR